MPYYPSNIFFNGIKIGPSGSTSSSNGLLLGNDASANLYRSAASTIKTDGSLIVTNHLSASTKSFLINHPTQEGKKLQYGVLEGPEHSVYIRGKVSHSNFIYIINFPDYWNKLVDLNSITVSLTPIKHSQNLLVKEINSSSVTIAEENFKEINCYYHIFGERKDVPKIQVEI